MIKLKRRIGSVFLACMMLLSLLPVTALAAEESWTEVNTAEALSTALSNGGNIKLTGDINVSTKKSWTVDAGKTVVLDLNNHAITSTYAGINNFLIVVNGGSLTLTDNSDSKGGRLEATDSKYGYGIQLKGTNSSFTLLAGTIQSTQETLDIYDSAKQASITISGGKLISTGDNVLGVRGSGTAVTITGGEMESNGRTGVYISCYGAPGSILFTMTGGKLTHTGGASGAIQLYKGATVTIGGDAEIKSTSYAVQVQENTILNVEGGKLESTGFCAICSGETSTVNVTDGTITSTSTNGTGIKSEDKSTVKISGGTVKGKTPLKETDDSSIDVTSGTFQNASGGKVDVSQYLPAGNTQDENGKVVVDTNTAVASLNGVGYTSIQAAVNAAKANETVTLLKDVVVTSPISVNTDGIVLDGGEKQYTISAEETSFSGDIITVYADGVTIKNIVVNGKGKSDYGIQFYTAADGKVENVTSSNNTKRGLHINASTVTASGTIKLEDNGWGDSINVGFGKNISDAPGASLNITNATLVGVDSIYADSGDVERATNAQKTISVTDGTNNYLAVGDTGNPICFMPQNVVKAEASYSRQSEDGSNVTYYRSNLKKAVDDAGSGDTITVLKNIDNAEGISVGENKNFTIDFAGHTYILTGPGAGSSGTETNGFQLLKDSTITMKNGTIRIAENASNINRIIQNYADLTLIDMQFYAENQVSGEDYPLSFNNGDITFKGNTSIFTTSDDTIAFDVCKYSTYPSVNVVFDTDYTGTINGRILYDSSDEKTHTLTINGNGTFGGIDFTAGNGNAAKEAIDIYSGTFCESVSEYVVGTLKYELRGADGTFTYYETEEAALAAAQPGDVVVAIDDISQTEYTVTVKNGDQIVAQDTVIANGKYILPATPSRAGYSFRGWYGNGHLYAAGDVVTITEDTTFVAQWSDNTPYYTITVKDADNGTVTCYAKSAAKGADVTLTVKADVGYQLDKLTVTDASGNVIDVEKVNNTTYTFVMPGSKVTVEAVFAPTTV
ncbi:MAG: InlB B-repeat-containing protein, partial [Clostridiales bacterium]|nr:InlB B-repeat-containing protein [Clostridiales bacterium]